MGPPIQREQPGWDRVIIAGLLVAMCGWMALMGLDAVRWRLSRVPVWLQAAGAVGILTSMYLCWQVFKTNSFAELFHRCHPFWVTRTEFYP